MYRLNINGHLLCQSGSTYVSTPAKVFPGIWYFLVSLRLEWIDSSLSLVQK